MDEPWNVSLQPPLACQTKSEWHRQKEAQLKVALKEAAHVTAHAKHVEVCVNGKMGQIDKEMQAVLDAVLLVATGCSYRCGRTGLTGSKKKIRNASHKKTAQNLRKKKAALKEGLLT